MTHYDVLGVSREASTAQVRAAFRRLARAHHPDTSTAGSAEALAPIHEAWRVLGDPTLRRQYDRSLAADVRPLVETDYPPLPTPLAAPESSFPWRFLAGMAAVGIGVVLLGVFTYKPSKPGPPDNVLQVGSCVVIAANRDATEVNCESRHDGVVERLLVADELCPAGLEPHRDSQGLGAACIRLDL
ncbi:MAG: molecular chaperone DnaJ [Ilumatobacteraceae bacterium]